MNLEYFKHTLFHNPHKLHNPCKLNPTSSTHHTHTHTRGVYSHWWVYILSGEAARLHIIGREPGCNHHHHPKLQIQRFKNTFGLHNTRSVASRTRLQSRIVFLLLECSLILTIYRSKTFKNKLHFCFQWRQNEKKSSYLYFCSFPVQISRHS